MENCEIIFDLARHLLHTFKTYKSYNNTNTFTLGHFNDGIVFKNNLCSMRKPSLYIIELKIIPVST